MLFDLDFFVEPMEFGYKADQFKRLARIIAKPILELDLQEADKRYKNLISTAQPVSGTGIEDTQIAQEDYYVTDVHSVGMQIGRRLFNLLAEPADYLIEDQDSRADATKMFYLSYVVSHAIQEDQLDFLSAVDQTALFCEGHYEYDVTEQEAQELKAMLLTFGKNLAAGDDSTRQDVFQFLPIRLQQAANIAAQELGSQR